MSPFDECGVLIPAATLEDFPADLSDYDARSLLAAWTVLWHPRLLAATDQIPTWYRADSPPDPVGARILTVPRPSVEQLPERYETQCRRTEGCQWITGADRNEMLEALALESVEPLEFLGRRIGVEDFFAAGFAVLQVQVMTRRLRYTSNLDEIHLQNRIVAAAHALLDQDAKTATDALHDVFDCLAEERDHYFASDPHLIDLTLMTDTTVESLLNLDELEASSTADAGVAATESTEAKRDSPADASVTQPEAQAEQHDDLSGHEGNQDAAAQGLGDRDPGCLPTPMNVLIDQSVARAIADLPPQRGEKLRQALSSGTIGWAGGGPPEDVSLDTLTFGQAESVFRQAHQATSDATGTPTPVYGRFSGATPSDITGTLVKLGYAGMIPIDFAGGTGFGDEAKVILRAGGAEIESLTAKPIDAAQDASFLSLGARLGEAIDSGEIATALLAHWPGQACDSFHDLRRVASWGLALGKFWKLDDYFREGEHPYHHGNAHAASPDSANKLTQQVEGEAADPLSRVAAQFRQAVIEEGDAKLDGFAQLLSQPTREQFPVAIGRQRETESEQQAVLLVNPHSVGCRDHVQLAGAVSKSAEHVFAVSSQGEQTTATVDIPACGFAVIQTETQKTSGGFSFGKLIGIGGPKPIADQNRLQNEFMEVAISPQSGAISGVYSGSSRGNRFSMRLVRSNQETEMRCQSIRATEVSTDVGTIETSGTIVKEDGQSIAEFKLAYTLRRGSRVLSVSGAITASEPLGSQPWSNYLGARVAVASEASVLRLLLRDKVHRTRGRRLVCPLGVVIDEAERQTLVSCDGLAYHVRVGDRFLDTMLAVKGETQSEFRLNYGFDVSNPVAMSKTLIDPPRQIPVARASGASELGWLVHSAPKDIVLSQLQVARRDDGLLAACVRVIQTRSKSATATLRFIHDVKQALVVDRYTEDPLNLPLPDDSDSSSLKIAGDQVSVPVIGHQVVDVLVIFADSGK